MGISEEEQRFIQAAEQLNAKSEERFERGEKPTQNEIIALAIVRPDQFEILVKLR